MESGNLFIKLSQKGVLNCIIILVFCKKDLDGV